MRRLNDYEYIELAGHTDIDSFISRVEEIRDMIESKEGTLESICVDCDGDLSFDYTRPESVGEVESRESRELQYKLDAEQSDRERERKQKALIDLQIQANLLGFNLVQKV